MHAAGFVRNPLGSGRRSGVPGFTLVEILIVVAIMGLLLAIAVPNFLKMRTQAQTRACISNLGHIDAAKQLWGLEKGKTEGDLPVEADLIPTYIKASPVCPAGGTYEFKPIGTKPTCTILSHSL